MAIAWKTNRDCPLCGKPLDPAGGAFSLPSAVFPGLGKPHGDFLRENDPLQTYCGRKVHRPCFDAWPERERFAASYAEWMTQRLDDDPERGTAVHDGQVLVSAPADPAGEGATILLLELATTATFWIPVAEWPGALDGLPQGAALRARFPTPRSLAEAVDWSVKETTCRICMKRLGANPLSPSAFRAPVSEAWTLLDPARPMRQYLGSLVHADCYAAWPKRPLFAATLTDIKYRLARLWGRACPHADAQSVVLLDRWGTIEVTVRATGTSFATPGDRWTDAPLPPTLRTFEREALEPVLAGLRAKFPTAASLTAAVDWPAVDAARAAAHEAFLVRLRELPIQARREGIRCPRCGRRVNDLDLSEPDEAAGCVSCGAALSPLDFGWLP